MIEILTENLAAGELKTFMMQGEYVEVLDAQYPLDVFMMDRSGGQISVMRKAEASFFSRPGRFEVIQLQSTNAQTVRVFVGSGDAGTRRAAGVVQMVDGEKNRTLAGGMFAGSASAQAVAGAYSQGQIWNPAGSGKNVIVAAGSASVPVAMPVCFGITSAALATDQTATNAQNKRGGGALGVAQIRYGSSGGILSPAFRAMYAAANQDNPWNIKGAVVLPPGFGLNICGQAVNAQVAGNFEYFEETI